VRLNVPLGGFSAEQGYEGCNTKTLTNQKKFKRVLNFKQNSIKRKTTQTSKSDESNLSLLCTIGLKNDQHKKHFIPHQNEHSAAE
jgi:hypothetical protein